jgi:hypothetical protein
MRHIGAVSRTDTSHQLRWRGQGYRLTFADVELEITDGLSSHRWPAVVAFSPAPIPYAILGNASCLQYFDARFLGADRTIELETNWQYTGTK